MKYTFIAAYREVYRVTVMCRVLAVKRSGYYAWKSRPPSRRAQDNAALLALIEAKHAQSRKTYGSPRVYAALQRQGVLCGHNRVARLMRLHGIVPHSRRPFHPTTTQRQAEALPAPNVLDQDFTASAPNRKWVTEIV